MLDLLVWLLRSNFRCGRMRYSRANDMAGRRILPFRPTAV